MNYSVVVDTQRGRELDAAVAREVFGVKVEPRTNDYVYEVQIVDEVLVQEFKADLDDSIRSMSYRTREHS